MLTICQGHRLSNCTPSRVRYLSYPSLLINSRPAHLQHGTAWLHKHLWSNHQLAVGCILNTHNCPSNTQPKPHGQMSWAFLLGSFQPQKQPLNAKVFTWSRKLLSDFPKQATVPIHVSMYTHDHTTHAGQLIVHVESHIVTCTHIWHQVSCLLCGRLSVSSLNESDIYNHPQWCILYGFHSDMLFLVNFLKLCNWTRTRSPVGCQSI